HSAPAVDELNDVYARLDRLTDQIEELARRKPLLRGAPTPPQWAPRLGEGVACDSADASDMPVSNASASPDPPSPATAPPLADAASEGEPPVKFPELEEQLRRITAQIESIRSTGLDTVIAAFRSNLAEIRALRGVVSHAASNDALNKVAEDVCNLAAKLDSLAKTSASGQAVSALGNRIDSLTDAINASAEINAPRGLEKLLSETMEKLESVRINTDPAAFKQLEERIAQLIGKVDACDARLGKLTAVERGF